MPAPAVAILAAVAAAALLTIPLLAGALQGRFSRGHRDDGPLDVEDMSAGELAVALAGFPEGGRAAKALATRVDLALREADPAQRDTARLLLEALVQARWHQDAALAALSPEERAQLLAADPFAGGADVAHLLARVDAAEVQQAMALLAAALQDLAQPPAADPPLTLAEALRPSVGTASAGRDPPSGAEPLARRLDLLLGEGAGAAALPELRQLPAPVRAALADILAGGEALAPMEDPEEALARLGARVDRARPALEAWSLLVRLQDLEASAGPAALPALDPDAAAPGLRYGARGPLELPPAPSLQEALARAAVPLGVPVPDASAAPGLDGLSFEQERALATYFDAVGSYEEALLGAALAPPPASAPGAPALPEALGLLEEDEWPADDPRLAALLAAASAIEAQHGLLQAQDALLAATEALVPAFALAAEQVPCDSDPVEMLPLLQLDPCGTRTFSEPAVLTLDVAGDDDHRQRVGAPFATKGPAAAQPQVGVPVTMLIDLGGSDTYTHTDGDCALAAACPDVPGVTGVDGPQHAWRLQPVAVLVDWAGNGTVTRNTFMSGARSQGFADLPDAVATDPRGYYRPYAALVEHAGSDAKLDSVYTAGDFSQGSATASVSTGGTQPRPSGGLGLLVRTVGSGSESTSFATAGAFSQGAHRGAAAARGPVVGAFLNVAGQDAVHDDAYVAGEASQGASASLGAAGGLSDLALFVDWAGPGSRSDDTYQAGDRSRGATPRPPQTNQLNNAVRAEGTPLAGPVGVFVDALAPSPPLSASVGDDLGQVEVQPAVTGSSDDAYDRVLEGNGFAVALFLDLQGRDGYEDDPVRGDDKQWRDPPQTAGSASWQPLAPAVTGVDAGGLADGDVDGMPTAVEDAWRDFVGLWDSSDDDPVQQPAPFPASVLIDTRPTPITLDRPYGLVLSVGGDDTYMSGFRAAIHIDLDGKDTYLGPTASATLLPPGFVATTLESLPGPTQGAAAQASVPGFDPASLLPGIDPLTLPLPLPVKLPAPLADGGSGAAEALPGPLGEIGQEALSLAGLGESSAAAEEPEEPAPSDGAPVPAPPQPGALTASPEGTEPQPAGGPRGLALHLDLQGNDRYLSTQPRAQGFGQGRAAGVLLDLEGSDVYSAPRAAQGVGIDGGLGVLVDLGPEGTNALHAAEPARGAGHGTGSLGLLVVEGRHNQAPDGGAAGERARPGTDGEGAADGGLGASLNVASDANGGPAIGATAVPGGVLKAGQAYLFTAEVSDPQGDSVEVCWRFETGTGPESSCDTVQTAAGSAATAEVSYAWTSVPTDSAVAGQEASRVFNATVEARDPGGKSAAKELGSFEVANPPPQLLAPGLRGPLAVVLPGSGELEAAYQPVLSPTEWAAGPSFEADWGDGSASGPAPAEQLDWLRSGRGATMPETVVSDGMPMGRCLEGLAGAFDGDDATFLEATSGLGCPMVHAIVDLPDARRITEVRVAATIGGSTRPMLVSIEAVNATGAVRPLRQVLVSTPLLEEGTEPHEVVIPLGGAGDDLVSIQVRQLSDPAAQGDETLHLHAIEAVGPGLLHTWRGPGSFPVAVTAIDPHGGRDTAGLQVDVTAAGGQQQVPLELADVGGRGPVLHASLAAGTSYAVVLRADRTEEADACVDWGDGSARQCLSPAADQYLYFRHTWTTPGDHEVTLEYLLDGRSLAQASVTTVHVAVERVDVLLHTADLVGGAGAAGAFVSSAPPRALGLLFIDAGETPTWYSGAPYAGVLDVGGNDRYAGRVASSMAPPLVVTQASSPAEPSPWPTNIGALPTLHVDLAGDDDYLSTVPGTQGFATAGGVALLADLRGNDVYVAPGFAQGSASNAGFAALLDLGGTDWLNAVAADHPAVLAGLPAKASPWAQRPAALEPARAPAGRGPDHVQGAGQEGLGVLVLGAGSRILHAGEGSQAHGRHLVAATQAYLLPDPGPCGTPHTITTADLPGDVAPPGGHMPLAESPVGPPNDVVLPPPGPQNPVPLFGPDPTDPFPAFDERPLCSLGVRDWQTIPISEGVELAVPQDITRFNDFVQNRGRYGPGLGVLANLGGGAIATGLGGQGSTGPAGRALLANAAGALVAVAEGDGQAFADGGQAGLASTGAAVLRLVGGGQGEARAAEQAPDPVAAPQGVLAVREGSDFACDGCDGNATTIRATAGAPGLEWATLPAAIHASQATATVLVRPAADLPFPGEVEVLAVALPRPWATDGTCAEGAGTLGRPVRLLHAPAPAATTLVPIAIDLGSMLADGPVLPASCLQLRVMARQVAGGSATEWKLLSADLPARPPPAVRLGATRVVGSSADVTVPVFVDQPAATAAPPVVRYAVLPLGEAPTDETEWTFVPSWSATPSGAVGQLTWSVTPTLPVGQYRAWTRSEWDDSAWAPQVGNSVLGPWTEQPAVFLVDRTPPFLGAVAVQGSTPVDGVQGGRALRLGRTVVATGEASDLQGVAAVEARLVDPAGALVPLAGDADGVAVATLQPIDDQRSSWSASLVPGPLFTGGWTRLQVRVLDGAGASTPWDNLATTVPLLLDGGAPRVAALELEDGGTATNGKFPLHLEAFIEDPGVQSCATDCPAGVGTGAGDLRAVVVHSGRVVPLKVTGPTPEDGRFVYRLTWDESDGEDDEPAPAVYRIRVQVEDRVDNVGLHEAGSELHVDQTAPRLEGLQVTGGPAVRPGQELQVRVEAFDPSSGAGVLGVEARLLGAAAPLAKGAGADFSGPLTVPDAGGLPAVRTVPLRVEVRDRAGNLGFLEQGVAFHAANFVAGVEPRARSDSLTVNLTVEDRSFTVAESLLRLAAGGPAIPHVATPIDDGVQLAYAGLAADTQYLFTARLRDAAGWERLVTRELATPLANEGSIALDPLPGKPVSTTVRVTGNVSSAVLADVVLTLQAGTATGPLQDTVRIEDVTAKRPFVLEWTPPEDLVADVPLFIRLDDGDRTALVEAVVRVDTRDPALAVRLLGNRGANGWFTGPVVVQPLVEDDSDTLPVTIRGETRDTITINVEGRHEIAVVARDDVLPPNEAVETVEVKYDRTPPTLQAALAPADPALPFAFQRFTGCDPDATCWWAIPLAVQADDPLAGVDAFRLTVAGTESEWQGGVPRIALLNTSLPDGEYALRVTVRDAAGNLDGTTISLTLDTAAPRLLAARWVGHTDAGTGIVHVVGLDALSGGSSAQRPSGIQAVRFSSGDSAWTPWIATDGNDAVEVPGGLASGRSLAIQLRDRAGNVGTADVVEPLPPPTLSVPPSLDTPPSALLLEAPLVAPMAGDESTPFAFSVLAAPAHGKAPAAVWAEVDGIRHAMEASGPARADGGQLYTVTLGLEATRLHEPHVVRFIAAYGGVEVASEPQPGPLVVRSASEPAPAAGVRPAEEAPFPAALAFLALLVAAVAARGWRRR